MFVDEYRLESHYQTIKERITLYLTKAAIERSSGYSVSENFRKYQKYLKTLLKFV